MERLGYQWTDFMRIITLKFFKILLGKFNFNEYLTIITGTLHEDLCSFMIMSRSIRLTITA